jgi:hypothetical protein
LCTSLERTPSHMKTVQDALPPPTLQSVQCGPELLYTPMASHNPPCFTRPLPVDLQSTDPHSHAPYGTRVLAAGATSSSPSTSCTAGPGCSGCCCSSGHRAAHGARCGSCLCLGQRLQTRSLLRLVVLQGPREGATRGSGFPARIAQRRTQTAAKDC